MIAFRHTVTTKRAVLRSRWFDKVARFAHGTRPEEDMVIRVVAESILMIRRCDVVVSVRNAEVSKPVWREQYKWYRHDQIPWQAVEGVPEKEDDTPSQYE